MTTEPRSSGQLTLGKEFRDAWQQQHDHYSEELEAKEAQRDEINAQIRELRRLVNGLRGLLGQEPLPPTETQPEPATAATQSSQTDGRSDDILALAEAVLEENQPEPMHWTELVDEIQRRGGKLPAREKSRYDSLLRLLIGDTQARFVRPEKRGYYALKKYHQDAENVAPRGSRSPN